MRTPSPASLPLYLLLIGALAGCARDRHTEETPRASPLEQLPFVYKMTVQQGNIVTEEMVDALKPGMSRAQVRYLLGTPPLVDFFHTNRWDYTYTIKRGHQPMDIRYLTLYFEGDSLARIEGDLQPNPERAAEQAPRQILVEVPDHEERTGLLRKTLESIGLQPSD
ncbi:MAG: outer membrane protein assembly factor BamE [Chromatiaceae bacterium]|nr:outer membrane protein assembly factor BamE [Chromatiaceae bacterium]